MKEPITLEFVAENLNLWRKNKPKSYSKIPQNIRDLIKSISQRYTYKQLSKALNIHGAGLTNIIKPCVTKTNKLNFIELPKTISDLNKSILTHTTCTLQHPNGTTMVIEVANQQLPLVIKDFICCN